MERKTGFNMKQIMMMLSTALAREDETWMPSSFAIPGTQEDTVNSLDRSQVIEWFMSLNEEFGFYPEALFMSVSILDRFLNSVKVKPKYLKCVAVTCFYLGAKATEEDECIPSTSDLVHRSGCGCSVSEVHRMEQCILDKFNWDLRLSTPLNFLHLFHGLLMSTCPNLLNGFPPMSPSQHLHQVTAVLQQCLLHHQLTGFAPSVLALATLSLDLEDFCPFWAPVTGQLQKLVQVDQKDIFLCKKLVLRCLSRQIPSPTLDCHMNLWTTKLKVDKDTYDIYDGIEGLYSEEVANQNSSSVMRMTCGSQVMRMTAEPLFKPAFAS